MTGKKIIILGLLTLLITLLPTVKADVAVNGTNEVALAWYEFDGNYTDIKGAGGTFTFDAGSGTFNTTWIEFGNSSVSMPDGFQMLGSLPTIAKENSLSVSIWDNEDSNESKDISYIINIMAGTNERLHIDRSGSDVLFQGTFAGPVVKTITCSGCGDQTAGAGGNMWTIVHDNASDILLAYLNDTNFANLSTAGLNFFDDLTAMRIGRSAAGDNAGSRDNLVVYRDVMQQENITNLWTGGSMTPGAGPAPPPAGGTINMSDPFPSNNTQFSQQIINFNASFNASNNFNVTFFVNGLVNQTNASVTAASPANVSFNVTWGADSEEEINFSFRAVDLTTGEIVNSTNHTVYIDTRSPVITTNWTQNLTVLTSNITGEFNFSDDFRLYSYNITIDGIHPVANASDIGGTLYTFNLSHNITGLGLSLGLHNLSIRLADGHTSKALRGNYTVNRGTFRDWIRFTTYNNVWAKISVEDGSIFDNWESEKKIDRYNFNYEPFNTDKEEYTFLIESNKDIDIIIAPKTYLKSWLILDGQHWLDFYLPTDNNVNVEYNRWTKKKVYVTISNITNKDDIRFESIGDLNIVTKNFSFNVNNYTLTYTNPVNALSTQTITLKIDKANGDTTTDASFSYNGDFKAVVENIGTANDLYTSTFITEATTSNESENRTLIWFYNVTGVNNTESGNITANQTVIFVGIDNCSFYSTIAINFTIFNETTSLPQIADLNAYMKLWVDNIANFTTFNLSWSNGSVYSVCITPVTATYNIYSQMVYSNESYASKLYYLTNMSVNNVTQVIPLYLTLGTTQTTFNVKDEDDDPIAQAIIKILSYDIATDTYKVTEIVRTDSQGVGLAQIIRNTKFYQFIVEVNGVSEFFSQPQKITSADNTFRITLGSDYFENYDISNNIASSLTFDNNTNTFTFVYSDTTGTVRTGCLEIIKRTYNGDSVVNQSCITSSAGSITLGIGTPSKTGSYLAKGTININPMFVAEILGKDFNENFATLGDEGIFLSFLMVVGITMVGLFSPLVAVFLLMIGVIGTLMLGTFHLTFQFLIAFVILGGITIYRMRR